MKRITNEAAHKNLILDRVHFGEADQIVPENCTLSTVLTIFVGVRKVTPTAD